MRWQKEEVRVSNRTKQTLLGDRIRLADRGLMQIVGLLGETGLEPGDGLLIVPSEGVHTWFMRFPIDVLVLDRLDRVIGLRENMKPFRVTKIYSQGVCVVELPAGTIAATRTEVGDELEILGSKKHADVKETENSAR